MKANRKISMAAGGLTETRERSPKVRVSEREGDYFKRCISLLEREGRMNPEYLVGMSVDHRAREVIFNYSPKGAGLNKRLDDTLRNIDATLRKMNRKKIQWLAKEIMES